MSHSPNPDADLRRRAEEAGLAHLLPEHAATLAAALAEAGRIVADMPRDLEPADEPAHVFRLDHGWRR